MLERWITALHVENPGLEEPAATRERLRDRFPKNATRRMTQLGLLVGATLEPLSPGENDTIVYASAYAETRALEGYLDSFPSASPTLFQTSIHPSAVQQALIARQQAVRQFFPMTGDAALPAQALTVALLANTPRTILCGGDERGTWLLENHAASARAFAFALALSASPEGALGRITLEATSAESAPAPVVSNNHDNATAPLASANSATAPAFTLVDFFDLLNDRRAFSGFVSPGVRLSLAWQ